MGNLFKTHITALEKVRNSLYSPSTNMNGTSPISFVMTLDDANKKDIAIIHIQEAIKILKMANK